MPRNVRNFWIEASVDGRKSDISTGPRSSGGGFSCTIYVREEGSISDKKLRIGGQYVNGKNILSVELVEGGGVTKELRLEVDRDEAPKPKVKKAMKAVSVQPNVQPTLRVIEGTTYIKVDLDHEEVELCQSWYSGQSDPLYGLQCTGLIEPDSLEWAISNLRKVSDDDVQTANGLICKLEQFLLKEESEPKEEKSEPPQREDAFWRIVEVKQ